MGRGRGASDKVFGFTLNVITFVCTVVVFFAVWWPAFLVSVFVLVALKVESFLLPAIVATVVAAFVVWFLIKATDILSHGVVALFGNEPASKAAVAQYQGTRSPTEVIVEDEIEQGDDLEVRLQRLANLRDRGLITPEDYETQKRRLLDSV